jgi:hypothetical protein
VAGKKDIRKTGKSQWGRIKGRGRCVGCKEPFAWVEDSTGKVRAVDFNDAVHSLSCANYEAVLDDLRRRKDAPAKSASEDTPRSPDAIDPFVYSFVTPEYLRDVEFEELLQVWAWMSTIGLEGLTEEAALPLKHAQLEVGRTIRALISATPELKLLTAPAPARPEPLRRCDAAGCHYWTLAQSRPVLCKAHQ